MSQAQAQDSQSPSFAPVDPATLSVRFMLIQDQLRMAAEKVNLLAGMGLSHTQGYRDAFAAYQAKLADFNALKEALGA
jgi:hypothetical protein